MKKLLLVMLILLALLPMGVQAQEESASETPTAPKVQEFDGVLPYFGSEDYYLLPGMKAGDTLYLSVEEFPSEDETEEVAAPVRINMILSTADFNVSKLNLAAETSSLGPTIQILQYRFLEDGDYGFYVLGSSRHKGSYHLAVGVNAPDVLAGTAEPTGDTIATFDEERSGVVAQDCESEVDTSAAPVSSSGENADPAAVAKVQEILGTLQQPYARHIYDLPNLRAGDMLYISLSNRCSTLDPMVELRDSAGQVLLENDDRQRREQDSMLVYEIPDSGDYQVLVRDCCGNTAGNYRLMVGVNAPGVLDKQEETTGHAIAVYNPETSYVERSRRPVQQISAALTTANPVHTYRLQSLEAGTTVYVYVQSEDPRIDPFARLMSSSEATLIEDDDSGGGVNAALAYEVPEDGNLSLAISSCCGAEREGAYRLLIGINNPDVLLNAARPTDDIIAIPAQNQVASGPYVDKELSGFLELGQTHYYELVMDFSTSNLNIQGYVEATSGNGVPQLRFYHFSPQLELSEASAITEASQGTQFFGFNSHIDENNRKASILDEVLPWEYTTGRRYLVEVTLLPSVAGETSLTGYTLNLGINRPDLISASTPPADESHLREFWIKPVLAESQTSAQYVQEFTGTVTLTENTTSAVGDYVVTESYSLRSLGYGDEIYVRLETEFPVNGWQALEWRLPALETDFGQTIPDPWSDDPISTTSYAITTWIEEPRLDVTYFIGYSEELTFPIEVPYRLLIGVNAPEVMEGTATPTAETVLAADENAEGATPVEVGVELLQISEVDQQAKNYSIVGVLRMRWHDETMVYHPADFGGLTARVVTAEQFEIFFGTYPNFEFVQVTFANQQGGREAQNSTITVHSDGMIDYVERFTVTLQAPDFNFADFPFDTQDFRVRVQTIFPSDEYVMVQNPDWTRIGNDLGEEEWRIISDSSTVEEVNGFSQFIFSFEVTRHLNFYIFRMLLPVLTIILMAWAILFIGDYEKRIEAMGANLLLFIAFSFTIADELPRLGYLTFMDVVLLVGFLITSGLFAADIYLYYLEKNERGEAAKRYDYWIIRLYPVLYLFAFLLPAWYFLLR